MTITLEDIAESEKICEAATEGPLEIQENGDCEVYDVCKVGMDESYGDHEHIEYWGIKSPVIKPHDDEYVLSEPVAKRIEHSYNTLPVMNALVREMYEAVKHQAKNCIDCGGKGEFEAYHEGEGFITDCSYCRPARRLVERMEGER